MNQKVNIICLYWVGDFRGRDFQYEDIERLYESVEKHIDRDFEFYILTNDDVLLQKPGVRGFHSKIVTGKWVAIPLLHNWPGWWAKMELHRPDLPKGRTLYMDLDSHCINSLGPILDYPGNLVMFNTKIPKNRWKEKRKEGWACRYQAATMLFDPGSTRFVYESFCNSPKLWMKKYRSDQDVMGDWIPDQPTFPDNWMIKLNTIRNYSKPPDDVIIVTGRTQDNLFRETHKIPWFETTAR